jgi:hypothetical protein
MRSQLRRHEWIMCNSVIDAKIDSVVSPVRLFGESEGAMLVSSSIKSGSVYSVCNEHATVAQYYTHEWKHEEICWLSSV